MNQKGGKESMDGERTGVKICRDFDFPRKSVFNMFTDAKKAAKFWGPEGAVNLVFELEPRAGGVLRIHDRNSEGITFRTSGTIVEIVDPELLVFRSATTPGDGAAPWEALQRVTFDELGPKRTRVTAHVTILTAGAFTGGVESLEGGFQAGWGQTFDRLQRELR